MEAFNPVFDVTPADLIDVIVTEKGIVERPDTIKQCGNHGSLLQSANTKFAPRPARRSRPYL
ncbi:hypothetical protein [Klebsiella pneumoniae]|uniref:hypothetical protein n=1 Tax=Klebsiella pneumoniae TaxID=573 RepID=UPI0034DE2E99